MNPIIKLSDNAAQRIKEIMSNAEKESLHPSEMSVPVNPLLGHPGDPDIS